MVRFRPYQVSFDHEERIRAEAVAIALEVRDGVKWTTASVMHAAASRGLEGLETELGMIRHDATT